MTTAESIFALVDRQDVSGLIELFAEDATMVFGNAEPLQAARRSWPAIAAFYRPSKDCGTASSKNGPSEPPLSRSPHHLHPPRRQGGHHSGCRSGRRRLRPDRRLPDLLRPVPDPRPLASGRTSRRWRRPCGGQRRPRFASSSGRTFVCPITGMKFASPPQRGTTCWCRCAAIPAPATTPWFMPMLKPCGTETCRITPLLVG